MNIASGREGWGRQCLVPELIDGTTRAPLFQAGVPVGPAQVLVSMQQIMRAMAHYQAKGITHDGLHVGNAMIQAKSGRIKTIDFGDAMALQRDLLFLATWGRALVKSREGHRRCRCTVGTIIELAYLIMMHVLDHNFVIMVIGGA